MRRDISAILSGDLLPLGVSHLRGAARPAAGVQPIRQVRSAASPEAPVRYRPITSARLVCGCGNLPERDSRVLQPLD